MSNFKRVILTLIAMAALGGPVWAAPKVVATVRPLHSLVADVMGDTGSPSLLIKGITSPHDFAMKPSDAQLLQDAELVFWIGPTLENRMKRQMAALAGSSRVIQMMDIELPAKLAFRTSVDDTAPEVGHDNGHEHEHDSENEQDNLDPHIWLDPDNAIAMVKVISEELSKADPANKSYYAENAAMLVASIQDLIPEISLSLEALNEVPFYVAHDGFAYFEARFGFKPKGILKPNAEIGFSAKRYRHWSAKLQSTPGACVFTEPLHSDKGLNALISRFGAHAVELDGLGLQRDVGAGLYIGMMRELAQSYRQCLSPSSQ